MNPKPVLSASSLACRRPFPTIDFLHCCEPTMVSPSTAYAPNQDPHLWGELPYFDRAGQKAQVGQTIFTGWAKHYSKCSPLQHCYFSFILRIIQISIQI
jgi:hypothetical protein